MKQGYALGQKLVFELAQGLLADLEISYRIPLTFAAGNHARYQKTPVGHYALFSCIEIDCNGPLLRTFPYVAWGLLPKLRGRDVEPDSSPVPENGGEVIWEGKMTMRLEDVRNFYGPARLILTTTQEVYGPDPLLCVVTNAEKQDTRWQAFWRWLLRRKPLGSGHAVTTSGGTVTVDYVRDA